MLAWLAALAIQGQNQVLNERAEIITRDPKVGATAQIIVKEDSLEPMARSPKRFGTPPRPWEFPWLYRGYTRRTTSESYRLRFRVYSQDRKGTNDPAARVTRMLTGLWEIGNQRIGLQHPEAYNIGIVDVYLCWGGKAGGEQRFDVTYQGVNKINVNTIYFYDLASFFDPVEAAREVAHEYGHAVLPAIGGYKEPEYWANGYLGERLFLMYAREAMSSGFLKPEDLMLATPDQLDGWLKKQVEPLVLAASDALPTRTTMADTSAGGMNRYMGLALYAATVLPDSVFGRSLKLTGSTDAADYPEAIALAAEEPDSFDLRIPDYLRGRTLWVPLNKGHVTGGKILRTIGKWAKVQPTSPTVTVVNRKI